VLEGGTSRRASRLEGGLKGASSCEALRACAGGFKGA